MWDSHFGSDLSMTTSLSVGEGAVSGTGSLHEILEEAHAEVGLLSVVLSVCIETIMIPLICALCISV